MCGLEPGQGESAELGIQPRVHGPRAGLGRCEEERGGPVSVKPLVSQSAQVDRAPVSPSLLTSEQLESEIRVVQAVLPSSGAFLSLNPQGVSASQTPCGDSSSRQVGFRG